MSAESTHFYGMTNQDFKRKTDLKVISPDQIYQKSVVVGSELLPNKNFSDRSSLTCSMYCSALMISLPSLHQNLTDDPFCVRSSWG